MASASSDGTVRLWDASAVLKILEGHSVSDWDSDSDSEGHSDWVNAITFSPDGKQMASVSSDGMVRLWDAAAGTVL